MSRKPCSQLPAWAELKRHFQDRGRSFHLRQAFEADARRFERFSQQAPHVFADLSKNLIDEPTEALLMALARQCGLEEHRDALFAGERINNTEQRAVMHWLLRCPPADPAMPAQSIHRHAQAELAEVHAVQAQMLTFAQQVRLDERITDVVNIGIEIGRAHV